jgi:hypothetical protein
MDRRIIIWILVTILLFSLGFVFGQQIYNILNKPSATSVRVLNGTNNTQLAPKGGELR